MAVSKELFEKVNGVIGTLRPFLQNDGGDIELIDITDDMVVKVQLQGACGCCPYSLMTLKNGVEQAIKREIPEITEVVNV